MHAHPRPGARVRRHDSDGGQAIVEFAFTMPIFVMFVFVAIQFGLIFIWYYSETRMARETARWTAVRPNSLDADVALHAQQTMLPGLIGGTPSLVTAGTTSTPTVYTVGEMTMRFTPCIPVGSPAICTHPDRAPGATLFVEMAYDASHIFFLPTSWQFGQYGARIPTSLPTHRVYVMAE